MNRRRSDTFRTKLALFTTGSVAAGLVIACSSLEMRAPHPTATSVPADSIDEAPLAEQSLAPAGLDDGTSEQASQPPSPPAKVARPTSVAVHAAEEKARDVTAGKKGRAAPRPTVLGATTGAGGASSPEEGEAPSRGPAGVHTGTFEGREARINDATLVAEDRFSTFAVDVDTAAYSIARRSLLADQLPNKSLVRVEELINYFHYDYDPPAGQGHPFSIQADGARSPVDPALHYLRIGLQARIVPDEERMPANLVFLVDTSCSMTSGDRLELAKKSLLVAVDHLNARDQVAITTYAGGVQVVLPPTSAAQKHVIRRAIEGLTTGGGTAMESGLTLAYKQAAAMLREGEITRIIVCSDGDANIGSTSPGQMLKQVEGYVSEGVTLSTIGFGDGNYKDATMEQLANKGNGNYYYVDTLRQAERVFGRDLTKMIQDVAQDVKVQLELDPAVVRSYRLVGYENRDVADRDFRNDRVDAGEIGAGHQVTALYELELVEGGRATLGTVRVRAKEPRGLTAKETRLEIPRHVVDRSFESSPDDLRFAIAVMGGAELLRGSPYAGGWSYARVLSIVAETHPAADPDRAELLAIMKRAAWLSGEAAAVSAR